MACDQCRNRDLEEFEDNLGWVEHVQRNQGIALVVIIFAGLLLLTRLNAHGVLTWGQLLRAPADG